MDEKIVKFEPDILVPSVVVFIQKLEMNQTNRAIQNASSTRKMSPSRTSHTSKVKLLCNVGRFVHFVKQNDHLP